MKMMNNEELKLNNGLYGLDSVTHLFEDKEEKGVARIERYEFKSEENFLYNLRMMRDGGYMFGVDDGHYTKLVVKGSLMMSDTRMERISNRPFVTKANGKVLIAGLGIGLIVHNILKKDDVTEVVVIEKYQDVIDLVAPKFSDDSRVKIICADIFEWKPEKGEKFDTVYFDIWPEISEENLADVKVLHNKFKGFVNRKNEKWWMNSWMKEFLQNRKRKESRNNYW